MFRERALSLVESSLSDDESRESFLEHREIEFGDKVNISDALQAARRIPKELLERKYCLTLI